MPALAGLSLALGGCGLAAPNAPSGVSLVVSRDFGAQPLTELAGPGARRGETVLRLLMGNARVTTRPAAGGTVQSINGLAAGGSAAPGRGWFFYVNGQSPPDGAAQDVVHPGDHIWWDEHDPSQIHTIPAVVGSFPEPFIHGVGGKRLPVRLECAPAHAASCGAVGARLHALGVDAFPAALGNSDESDTLRVLVGPWSALRADPAVANLAAGPAHGGVFVRFSPDGSRLSVLDPRGRAARTLIGDVGLVAATSVAGSAPVWILTGTTEAGVASAVQSFDAADLHNRFALVVEGMTRLSAPLAP